MRGVGQLDLGHNKALVGAVEFIHFENKSVVRHPMARLLNDAGSAEAQQTVGIG